MIRLFGRSLRERRLLFLEHRRPDDRVFLRASYRAYLKRDPDETGLRYYLQALQAKTMDRQGVLRSITESAEYKILHGERVGDELALHQARIQLVQTCLPPAEVIVDLGGAAQGVPEGYLLAMGYRYKPREIIIVDLPASERYLASDEAQPLQEFVTVDGVHIRYIYSSMADLSAIPSGSADLVWSGQSIEHVSEEDGDAVCREARRVLKPGGFFCLDTPNAALTRLQSPDGFLHPEHKKEYLVAELIAKLEQRGFGVIEAKGICPMPKSIKQGVFSRDELLSNMKLSDEPEESYLFFLKAQKT